MKGTAWTWIEDTKERLIEISDEIWSYTELGSALKAAREAAERLGGK